MIDPAGQHSHNGLENFGRRYPEAPAELARKAALLQVAAQLLAAAMDNDRAVTLLSLSGDLQSEQVAHLVGVDERPANFDEQFHRAFPKSSNG
jgi:hypothetical protein